jgi:hypothetical protein
MLMSERWILQGRRVRTHRLQQVREAARKARVDQSPVQPGDIHTHLTSPSLDHTQQLAHRQTGFIPIVRVTRNACESMCRCCHSALTMVNDRRLAAAAAAAANIAAV